MLWWGGRGGGGWGGWGGGGGGGGGGRVRVEIYGNTLHNSVTFMFVRFTMECNGSVVLHV